MQYDIYGWDIPQLEFNVCVEILTVLIAEAPFIEPVTKSLTSVALAADITSELSTFLIPLHLELFKAK